MRGCFPLAVIAFTALTACSEQFEHIDPEGFDQFLATRSDIATGVQLAEPYFGRTYGWPDDDRSTITVRSTALSEDILEATLIYDDQQDDSIRSSKFVITAKRVPPTWQVLEIKFNWRCYEGRGHTDWGIGRCN